MTDLPARLAAEVLDPLKRLFVGKDEIVDLLGLCLVAGENLFLLGPPGTAKSALVHALGRRLHGRTFDYLLTRFTEPNELFGPFDIRRLREGELVTNTEGMLPEADLVFLDELLNANSAVLNSLLMALNERIFRRGRETRALPMLMAIGASNRLPDDEALRALFDRFLVRVRSDNVPDLRLGDVLQAGWALEAGGEPAATFAVDDVRALRALARRVDLAPVRETYAGIVVRLRRAGIPISDRRAVRLQGLIAASAVLCGRTTAAISDCWVLRHAWDSEEQREALVACVQGELDRSPPGPDAHPQATAGAAPDPEAVARELGELEAAAGDADEVARARLRDRLTLLAARLPWVAGETQRAALQQRVDAAWRRLAP